MTAIDLDYNLEKVATSHFSMLYKRIEGKAVFFLVFPPPCVHFFLSHPHNQTLWLFSFLFPQLSVSRSLFFLIALSVTSHPSSPPLFFSFLSLSHRLSSSAIPFYPILFSLPPTLVSLSLSKHVIKSNLSGSV